MRDCFRLSSLIRGTLICVYLALVVPLPLMAPPSLQLALWIAAPLGLFIVLALLSEEVCIDEAGLVVGHPQWCRLFDPSTAGASAGRQPAALTASPS